MQESIMNSKPLDAIFIRSYTFLWSYLKRDILRYRKIHHTQGKILFESAIGIVRSVLTVHIVRADFPYTPEQVKSSSVWWYSLYSNLAH